MNLKKTSHKNEPEKKRDENLANKQKTLNIQKPSKLLKSSSINTKPEIPPKTASIEIKPLTNPEKTTINLKKDLQNYKLKNDLLKKENKDLKNDLEEKEKLLLLFEKDFKSLELNPKRFILLKCQIIKLEQYVKNLTNSIKSSNIFATELEYLIDKSTLLLDKLLKFNDFNEIHDKIALNMIDFKNLKIRMEESLKQKTLQYEKFLNRDYFKLENNDQTSKKKLLFNLEEELNEIFHIILNNENLSNATNKGLSLKLLKIVKNCMDFSLQLGLNLDDFQNNEDQLNNSFKDKQKNIMSSLKLTNKIFNDDILIFKAEEGPFKYKYISNKYAEFLESVEIYSSENNADVSNIIEKYQKNGVFIKLIDEFIQKNTKIFYNNEESNIIFEKLVRSFKNDVFLLTKLNRVTECLLFSNSKLLKNLSYFIEEKMGKIIEKIKEDVYSPFMDMKTLLDQKEEMEIGSYFIQISNLFEYHHKKMRTALEKCLLVEDSNSKNRSFKILLEIYKEIKKDYVTI